MEALEDHLTELQTALRQLKYDNKVSASFLCWLLYRIINNVINRNLFW